MPRSGREVDLAVPALARNGAELSKLQASLDTRPTTHQLVLGDARHLRMLESASIHLVLTSPPYWTLKDYSVRQGQLGTISDYEQFLSELDNVWRECLRVLVPGGRLIVVVGDVCLSRREHGRHRVVPLHADVQVRCREIGFDNLAPIIWYKIANASFEAEGNGAGFLGKPYEPNAVVKNDVEFILMQRKPGGYRRPDPVTRLQSVIPADSHKEWFRQIWEDVPGESTRKHPAPFPIELADRLIRMFSFAGDTVLDPFVGTGTTMLAAAQSNRNSVGVEIDPDFVTFASERLETGFSARRLAASLRVEMQREPGMLKP